jgi:hypothetical protein
MTLELKDGRYVSQMWYCANGEKDWLCALYRDPGERWTMLYRFRYYRDDKVFDSKDIKNWYCWRAPTDRTESEVIKFTDSLAEFIALEARAKLHKLFLRTDKVEKILEAMKHGDFTHFLEEKRATS